MQAGAEGEGEGASRRREWLVLAAILVATVALYARGLAGQLVYDDRLLIERNPEITDLANLPRLFGSGYWDFLGLRDAEYIGYWRPLTAVVHALVWPLAQSRPGPYHAASLAFHLAATVAAFLLARRLSGRAWIAGTTALLFALHPTQVESVAWISALSGPLSGCLVLFALERFLAWRARGSPGVPVLAPALFVLALLAKELAATLVPLLVLLDLTRPRPAPASAQVTAGDGRVRPARLRAYAPFALACALYLGARMLVFESPYAGLERVTTDFVVGPLRLALLRLELFGGALEILAAPLELNLFRPFRPYLAPFDPTLVRAAVFTAVYLALLVASWRARRRLALTALLAIPLGFLPVLIQVHSLGTFPLSERFLYLPAFGFALGLALVLARTFSRRTATLLVLALGALYGARSHARIGVWHDGERLLRDSAAHSPRAPTLQWIYGRELLERFSATHEPRYLLEAQRVFEHAVDLLEQARAERTDLMTSSRDTQQVELGLAWCAIHAGDPSSAILRLTELARRIEAIQAGARAARAQGKPVREEFLDLGQVLGTLAVAQMQSGELDEAERSFARALAEQPNAPDTHQNLGRLLAQRGRWPEAAREFESAARLRPGNPEDRLLLAQALQTLGEDARAEALARALLVELPRRAEPPLVLAVGALQRKDSDAALAWLERALALEPENALAWSHKARILWQRGEPRSALAAFRKAVELGPTNFEAHHEFAGFLLAQGALAEAQPYLVRAYVLAPAQHRGPLRRNLEQLELDGPTLLELERSDAARDELPAALGWNERRLARAPEDAGAALEHARILRRLGRDEEALAVYRAQAERAPQDYVVWSELGAYLHALGRLDQARPALEHALALEPPREFPPELRESSKQRLRTLLE